MNRRLPAEWEEQDGILLAWPHAATDWRDILSEIEPVFITIAQEISRFEKVLIVAPEPEPIREQLTRNGVIMERVLLRSMPTNDTWARDFGPITVWQEQSPMLLDFGFNGWGLKFAADLDNRVTRNLARSGIFGNLDLITPGLILEGGSIESDGAGTLLTTSNCLLEANRNPQLNRQEIERSLARLLGVRRFLWLENGYLAGDDTDAHIDTLARLCPDHTILYVQCSDPTDEHYPALAAMEEELKAFRTADNQPYRLIPLPWPQPCFDEEGQRLPATYANFLILNRAVLVPTYREQQDAEALAKVAEAFPGREIIGIDCLPLIRQHGSLHCVTMQLPKGVLA